MDERPFDIRSMPRLSTGHPASVYLNGPHEAAVSFLLSFFADTGGIAMLTGEPGVGRNTAIVTALQVLAQPASVVTVSDLSPPTLQALSDWLPAQPRSGHLTLFAVEDVEQLTAGALEGVRRLAALEDTDGPLLHVLLVGAPGSECLLATPPLSVGGARIHGHWNLRKLDSFETAGYIAHRLFHTLAREPQLFPPEVCRIVHAHTGGVPRLIDAALQAILGEAADRRTRTMTPRLAYDALARLSDISSAADQPLDTMAPDEPPHLVGEVSDLELAVNVDGGEARARPERGGANSAQPAENLATNQPSPAVSEMAARETVVVKHQHARALGLLAIAAAVLAAIALALPRWQRTSSAPSSVATSAAAEASTAPVPATADRALNPTRAVGTAGATTPPVTRTEAPASTVRNVPRLSVPSDARRSPAPTPVNAARPAVSPTPNVPAAPAVAARPERVDRPAVPPQPATAPFIPPPPAEVSTPSPEAPPALESTPRILRPSAAVPSPAVPSAAVPPAAVRASAVPSGAAIARPVVNAAAIEEHAVRTVLDRYRVAFNTLDARAAAAVWPSVDAKALGRAFERLQEQEVSFVNCQVAVTDTHADASCGGNSRYVPKVGNKNPRDEAREWTFGLEKIGAEWRIRSVTMR